jgi:dihydroflavonol-4-reductase
VTGATGFLGAHLTRLLCGRGDDVQTACRNPGRSPALADLDTRRVVADVCDYRSLRRAFAGTDVVFHTAGYVGSRPTDWAWRINAEAPVTVVEAAAAAGCQRVVLTSSISAIGLPENEHPADEETQYPKEWLGLTYPDSKHEGERMALEAAARHGVELVVVNPGYVLGVPLDPRQASATSTRTVGSYLRGRLPGVIAAPMNFVDVEDVATGHLLAAERGTTGERYILAQAEPRRPGPPQDRHQPTGCALPLLRCRCRSLLLDVRQDAGSRLQRRLGSARAARDATSAPEHDSGDHPDHGLGRVDAVPLAVARREVTA